MNIIMYLRDVAVCFFAAFFYGRFMSVPVKPLIPSSLSAAFSYLVYRIIFVESGHELIGFLSAALTVSFVSEILARIYKMPATIFVMPGITRLSRGRSVPLHALPRQKRYRRLSLDRSADAVHLRHHAVAIAVVNALRADFGKREKGSQ